MRCHANAVAELAEERAARFGAAALGRICGLLHDVGKYSPEFQRKLRGEALRVDHSTAGARIAAQRYSHIGQLIAYVIAGHHAGLANGTGDGAPTPLATRLNPKQSVPKIAGWEVEISLPATLSWPPLQPNPDKEIAKGRKGHCLALLTRMLFSALIDADRLDTEAFYRKVEGDGEAPRGGWQPLVKLKQQLDQYMLELAAKAVRQAENDGQRAVNSERARVLAAARAKAREEPGLFSLTVPTGGGKTLASLTFALDHAVKHNLDRVIYVIPFTSIIEQTAAVFRNALDDELAGHVIEHHSAFREDEVLAALEKAQGAVGDESSFQAGERLRLATENWDALIIVTTAVQFFESLFSNRTSKCRKLHNIAKSIVILDEAQTLPLKLLRPCVAVLDELARNYKTSVVLCTATQPALAAKRPDESDGLAGGLVDVREIVDEPQALYERLKRVTVKPAEKMNDEELIKRLCEHDKVLCIVGTRAHARELFVGLQNERKAGTYHLSALMCPAHRSEKLREIKAALADGACRVVATTVVEAGVDIDFPMVYRIMAGLDSIAQAAGRCNREGKRPAEESIVQLFEIEGRKYSSIQALHANEDTSRSVLRRHGDDPLSLEAIRAYFEELYGKKVQGRTDGLDASTNWPDKKPASILEALNAQAANFAEGEFWLPFADVGRAFQMIDTAMEPVIIPYDDKARGLIAELEKAERPGGLARKLQPYIVNVPRGPFAELRQIGRIVPIHEYLFQDQFMRLTDEARRELYDKDVGFDWSNPIFRKTENNIV